MNAQPRDARPPGRVISHQEILVRNAGWDSARRSLRSICPVAVERQSWEESASRRRAGSSSAQRGRCTLSQQGCERDQQEETEETEWKSSVISVISCSKPHRTKKGDREERFSWSVFASFAVNSPREDRPPEPRRVRRFEINFPKLEGGRAITRKELNRSQARTSKS